MAWDKSWNEAHWQESECIPGGHSRSWWIRTNGPIPEGLWCNHYCDHPWCKNVNHMWLGTPSEDHQDSIAKGRRVGTTGQHLAEETKKALSLAFKGTSNTKNKGIPPWNKDRWWKKYVKE